MGPAQMLHQRIYDADVCLRQSGDADGGGLIAVFYFALRLSDKRKNG